MPYSFTQIEKDRTKIIGLVFLFLIAFYFLVFWLLGVLFVNQRMFSILVSSSEQRPTFHFPGLLDSIGIFFSALAVGAIHWYFSTRNIIDRMVHVLKAQPADDNDTYHKVFKNIVEEVTVATGGGRIIEPYVIPTMAMNAFALADLKGRCVIGVTEGVVSRLSRSQLESVVAHEAAHIVSGDCVDTTIVSSLFELYSGLLFGASLAFRGGRNGSRDFLDADRAPIGGVFLILVYLLLWLSKSMAMLVRMFVSRQREYRADAIAVRLTRNPLALAEALYAIAYHWRGSGLTAENMEAIFIVGPKFSYLEEGGGFLSNLFSTHPPFIKRVQVLLSIAHESMETMMNNVRGRDSNSGTLAPEKKSLQDYWAVKKEGEWKGPFNWEQLGSLDWIQPQTWIQNIAGGEMVRAVDDPKVAGLVSHRTHSANGCPRCLGALKSEVYEGVTVRRCQFCAGVVLKENDIKKIIIRQEYAFSDRIKLLAKRFKDQTSHSATQKVDAYPQALFKCPDCQKGKMIKRFYTYAYPVEIDSCVSCQTVFFDKDELEILQCMIEQVSSKE